MARTSDPHAATLKAWQSRRRAGADESEGLGHWSKDGKWQPNGSPETVAWEKHAATVAKMSPEEQAALGIVPVPLPVWSEADRAGIPNAQDWWTGHRPIKPGDPSALPENARLVGEQRVSVASLVATQHVVESGAVGRNVERLRGEEAAGLNDDIPPLKMATVLRVNGKHYIYDGHHRVAASKVMGQEETWARVYDLPELPA